jgi:CheY-like chemotaxis protein
MMNSELKVESIYGQGSRFYFSIWQEISDPEEIGELRPSDRKRQARKADGQRKYFTAPGRRILVVDDMPMNLQVLTGLLNRSEMIIETASGGEDCISKFGEQEYDIVFLDYRMPGMDGIETLHKLHEKYPDKVAHIPIIALTASAILGDKERLLKEGFTDYLAKPVVISDMEEMMARYLGENPATEAADTSKDDMGRATSAEAADTTKDDAGRVIEDETEDTFGEIPEDILGIKELDHNKGLEYCGDAEGYLFALQTYAESVEEKAASIEDCVKNDRIDEYVILTHSLKSMSKSIGAVSLYEKARALEQAGADGDKDTIRSDTESFVAEYRALGEKLMSVFS